MTADDRTDPSTKRALSMGAALLPVAALIVLLALSVYLYGADSSYGANQIALIFSAGIAALVGYRHGYSWREIESGIVHGISLALGALLILLAVGSLIGTWILAGSVPAMIYYGLKLLDPSIFYAASCLICAVVALSIGSSWTTAGTIGIGLMGVSAGMGLSPAITGGAIISGAYFGDKMSPLSDTTNLAPAVTGTDLFEHIRHMMWTTVPSILIALSLFTFLGFAAEPQGSAAQMRDVLAAIEQNYDIGWYLLIPLAVVVVLAARRFPPFPTIMLGALLGAVFAVLFQWDGVQQFAKTGELGAGMTALKGVWTALFDGYQADTGNAKVDSLLSRGGMSSMLNTVWLIITAMTFGAVMEKTGALTRIVTTLLGMARSTGGLVATTLGTCIGMNIIAADQYIAIVLPGRMYRIEFQRRRLAARNLSRTLEDAGTLTSVLIPWNTCGAYMIATLGLQPWVYVPFCFFNLLNPLIAAFYGYTGFRIDPMGEEELAELETVDPDLTAEAARAG